MLRKVLKLILPPVFVRFLSGLFYGWHGNYSSWNEASRKCKGYNSEIILEKVKASALKVKEGSASCERDSVLFYEAQYTFPVLSALMWIAAQNHGSLNVLDFGGSLGTTYYQNKKFLDSLPNVNWCIVEQPLFVEVGIKSFGDEKLHFFYSIEECMKSFKIDAVLLSSVLQYLEKPFILLDKIKSTGINYLIIDRTPFIKGLDRITIQKAHPNIYKGRYPCWFFNKKDFISGISTSYELIFDFIALDKANIRSEFKGFIFRKKCY